MINTDYRANFFSLKVESISLKSRNLRLTYSKSQSQSLRPESLKWSLGQWKSQSQYQTLILEMKSSSLSLKVETSICNVPVSVLTSKFWSRSPLWSIIEACFKNSWFILETYFQESYLLQLLSQNQSPNWSHILSSRGSSSDPSPNLSTSLSPNLNSKHPPNLLFS